MAGAPGAPRSHGFFQRFQKRHFWRAMPGASIGVSPPRWAHSFKKKEKKKKKKQIETFAKFCQIWQKKKGSFLAGSAGEPPPVGGFPLRGAHFFKKNKRGDREPKFGIASFLPASSKSSPQLDCSRFHRPRPRPGWRVISYDQLNR